MTARFMGMNVVADDRVRPGAALVIGQPYLVSATSVDHGGVVVTTYTYGMPALAAVATIEPKK
jgi:hypothetical protein